MSTDEILWVDRTIEVIERGVYLRFFTPEKTYYGGRTRPEKRGTVFVEDELLAELSNTSYAGPMLIITDKDVQQALADAGWINQTSRGGVYATPKFRTLWEEQD